MFVTPNPDNASAKHRLDLDAAVLAKMGLSISPRTIYLDALVCTNNIFHNVFFFMSLLFSRMILLCWKINFVICFRLWL